MESRLFHRWLRYMILTTSAGSEIKKQNKKDIAKDENLSKQ